MEANILGYTSVTGTFTCTSTTIQQEIFVDIKCVHYTVRQIKISKYFYSLSSRIHRIFIPAGPCSLSTRGWDECGSQRKSSLRWNTTSSAGCHGAASLRITGRLISTVAKCKQNSLLPWEKPPKESNSWER